MARSLPWSWRAAAAAGTRGRSVAERIKVGEAPSDVATGYGGVWLVNNEALQEIDPRRNVTLISQPPDVGEGGLGLALGRGIGVVDRGARRRRRAIRSEDATSARRSGRRARDPRTWRSARARCGRVSSAVGLLSRIDPRRERVTALGAGRQRAGRDRGRRRFGVGREPRRRRRHAHRPGQRQARRRADPRRGCAAGHRGRRRRGVGRELRRRLGHAHRPAHRPGERDDQGRRAGPSDVATGLGYVWVVNSKSDTLVRIDPAKNTRVGKGDARGHGLDRRGGRIRRGLGGRLAGQRDRTREALTEEREFPSWERRGADVGPC